MENKDNKAIETNYLKVGDSSALLKELPDECIDLVVTSPPYFNAREYSHWNTLDDYMFDVTNIFLEIFRVLCNHRYCVINVGDITSQVGKAKWAVRKLPLGAYFITMMERIGFTYIDDYIWDKGEPQTKRNLGNPPYPFYQYPVNCYEHILIFSKHQIDKTKIPCPDCNKTITVSNSQTSIGVQSWECKNPECPTKSEHGRGKRFSARSIMMSSYQNGNNYIPDTVRKKWRKDIVKINPVIKINNRGENTIGHSAPFPKEIPEMAIRFYSGEGDIVLDPFIGSGTTAVAALELNRRYIGFDISEEYIKIAQERVNKT